MNMEALVYNTQGKETGKVTLPEAVFGLPFNADLVHGVVTAMQANARAGTAHTKDRSEVSGGGKKPWKQKGTGRARHGSRRSPIWTGGGVAHGPRNEKDYSQKINKKVRRKALGVVLSKKFLDAEMLFVDTLTLDAPKTTEAKKALAALGGIKGYEAITTKPKNAALLVLSGRDENVEKSFRNFGNITVVSAKDVNPVDLLTFKYVVVVNPAAAVEIFEGRIAGTKEAPATVTKK
jgi:large subunit ribosomal protein L4